MSTYDKPQLDDKIWFCKVGGPAPEIRKGGDAPMRKVVEEAFHALTGVRPEFCFSGWGSQLTEGELAVVGRSNQPAEGVPQDSAWQPEPVTGYGPKLLPQVSGFDLPITDSMAYAFHNELSDSSIGAEEVEDLKRGLKAAFAHVAPQVPVESLQVMREVLAERDRQIKELGWTREHDDQHVNEELAALSAYYLMPPAARDWDTSSTGYGDTLAQAILPSDWTPKPGDRRRELIKGMALALAELERIDRAEGVKQ